jgi:hypothetical protein
MGTSGTTMAMSVGLTAEMDSVKSFSHEWSCQSRDSLHPIFSASEGIERGSVGCDSLYCSLDGVSLHHV